MKRLGFVLVLLSLGACEMSFSTLDKALPLFKGQSISMAIDKLGIPSSTYKVDDKDVYVWSTSQSFTSITPITNTSYGSVGMTPFNATTTSYESETENLSCTIKMMTKNKIVQKAEYSGNNGACFQYSEPLKAMLKK